jgi:molybdate transport system ATP-binding protein
MSPATSRLRLSLPRSGFALDLDIELPPTGITVLFGPSGSGKTTVLRCVAGLEHAPGGLVQLAGECWQDDARGVFVPTWRRRLGYVFQEASLFEHLDVAANLRFGQRRVRGAATAQALEQAIDLLGIGHLLGRRTGQLSGGERQRVAIARALATDPAVLLLDEPLAALDLARRLDILPWLEKLHDSLHIPMLYVTHSADELARLADHLVLMDQGQVRAAGPVQEVLARVDLPVVVGEDAGVLLQAEVVACDPQWHLARVRFAGGELWLRDSGLRPGQAVRLRVLARDVSLTTQPAQGTSIQNHLSAEIEAIAPDPHPSQALVRLRCGEAHVLARVTRRAVHELGLATGQRVWAQVKSVALAG